jgi:hypothetical protein
MKFALTLVLSPVFVACDLFQTVIWGRRYKAHVFALLDTFALSFVGLIITGILGMIFFSFGLYWPFVVMLIYILTCIGSLINLWFFTESKG